MTIGAFTFVLHSHLPYCRMAGRWPHGEEWIHEAASETYIPLLNSLNELRTAKIPARLTIGLTPILVEQLADPDVQDHLDAYLDEKIESAKKDIARFEKAKDAHMAYLAQYYTDWFEGIKRGFNEDSQRNIPAAFKELQDDGIVEIINCAATHGYLPLLSRDSSIYGRFWELRNFGIWQNLFLL